MPADDHDSDEYDSDDDVHDHDSDEYDSDDDVDGYDKLVRDGIPAVVRADGNLPVTRRVDGPAYDRYLAAKLREEVDEVLDAFDARNDDRREAGGDDGSSGNGSGGDERSEASGDEAVLSELADAYAVLDAMAAARDYSMTAVRERAREKADARGGFADGVVLERIDPPPSGDVGIDVDADDES